MRGMILTEQSLFFKESDQQIINNTIPCGFVFNRVGTDRLDINLSGALYACYDKDELAKYMLTYSSEFYRLVNIHSNYVQHIIVKEPLKLASQEQTITELAKLFLSDESLLSFFRSQLADKTIRQNYKNGLKKALTNPNAEDVKKFVAVIFVSFSQPSFANKVKVIYDHFRKCGFDAVPDLADVIFLGNKTATIILNTKKVELLEAIKFNE